LGRPLRRRYGNLEEKLLTAKVARKAAENAKKDF
jgi:hypothetical protein